MTVCWSALSSGARASSQARTDELTPLAPPGSAMTLPNVASAPSSAAAWRAASTVLAYGSIGSFRSASRAVPAWSGRPAKSKRHRPCGQIPSATPIAAPSGARARPCSTCSSTNAPNRASRSSSGPIRLASQPAAVIAAASVTPSSSPRARAAPGSMAPVIRRLPRQGTRKRAPSSSVKTAIATGRSGLKFLAFSSATAASADATPSAPSYPPPSGTESRWLPVTTASSRAAPHQAHRLPLRSCSAVRPSPSAWRVNQARHSASAGVQE